MLALTVFSFSYSYKLSRKYSDLYWEIMYLRIFSACMLFDRYLLNSVYNLNIYFDFQLKLKTKNMIHAESIWYSFPDYIASFCKISSSALLVCTQKYKQMDTSKIDEEKQGNLVPNQLLGGERAMKTRLDQEYNLICAPSYHYIQNML